LHGWSPALGHGLSQEGAHTALALPWGVTSYQAHDDVSSVEARLPAALFLFSRIQKGSYFVPEWPDCADHLYPPESTFPPPVLWLTSTGQSRVHTGPRLANVS
jgi:hypothetical protein